MIRVAQQPKNEYPVGSGEDQYFGEESWGGYAEGLQWEYGGDEKQREEAEGGSKSIFGGGWGNEKISTRLCTSKGVKVLCNLLL